MRLSISTKLLLSVLGIWVITYGLLKGFLIYLGTKKFDMEKYRNIHFFPLTNDSTETLPFNLLPKTDYHRLIDIDFNFTINNPCNAKPFILLVLVDSAPMNFANRTTVRETWGKNQDDVKILFVLASTNSTNIQDKIIEENRIYNDIIQGNFTDAYRNLTYKHLMDLKYVVYHCPFVKYVIKTDDDAFINIPFMKNFLTNDVSPYGARNLLMGYVVHNARSFRTYRSKWRVTFEEYKYKHYPTYCLGWIVLYSPDLLFKFYKETQQAKFFWIDDVLITGVVAKKLNFVDYIDITPLTLTRREVRSLVNATYKYRPFLYGHADMTDYEIRQLWKYVISSPTPKSVKDVNYS